ncbi:MAG: ATP-binding protein [Planctomycetota bacterium]
MAATPDEPQGPARNGDGGGDSTPSEAGSREVAHELANLLDGSMRSLGLGLKKLDGADGDERSAEALQQLRVADQAMKRMAALLRQWMGRSAGVGGVLAGLERGTLGEAIDHAVELTRAGAEARGVRLTADVSTDAAALPAGPVYGVVVNGLRNAMEAIDAADRGGEAGLPAPGGRFEHHEVAVRAWVEGGDVRLTVTDSGAGVAAEMLDAQGAVRVGRSTKETGRGIGLAVGREVIEGLGGRLRLKDREDERRGAVLTLRWPRAAIDEGYLHDRVRHGGGDGE